MLFVFQLAFLFVAVAQETEQTTTKGRIDLKGERLETTFRSSTDVATELHSIFGQGKRRALVQFDRPLSLEERATLEQAGVSLQSFLGDNAFFVSLSSSGLDLEKLGEQTSLRYASNIQNQWKLEPSLSLGEIRPWTVVGRIPQENQNENTALASEERIVAINLLFHPDVVLSPDGIALVLAYGAEIKSTLETIHGLVIEIPESQIQLLAENDEILWIESPLPAFQENNDGARQRTQANAMEEPPYNLDGSGVTVMVYDAGGAVEEHPDFGGRLHHRDNSALINHATHVAGTIGGSGVLSNGLFRGMAPGVTMESYGFQMSGGGIFLYTNPGDLQSNYSQAIQSFGADIANNSIGTNTCRNELPCDITGNYGITDQLIDSIVRGSLGSPFRIIFSNGNERGCPSEEAQACQGIHTPEGYHSTAPPACAKNHITVGAINSNNDSMTQFSSWGPTDDGRLKPEICAPGCQANGDGGITSAWVTCPADPFSSLDECPGPLQYSYEAICGTSMAGPVVTGLSALILQDWRNLYPGQADPRNSLLKVLLTHNAADLENPGPDYKTGFGSVRVKNTIDFLRTGNFREGSVTQGQSAKFWVLVPDGYRNLKLTLAWDDYPAVPLAQNALVNDLDLKLFSAGQTPVQHFPWTLNPQTPSANAVRTSADRRNNIEQVFVEAPTPGFWRVEIAGFSIPQGPQTFSLCASLPLVTDCNDNGVADNLETDCNGNLIPDVCELSTNSIDNCDGNNAIDSCEVLATPSLVDCNANSIPDACDVTSQSSRDCNQNGIPEECDFAMGLSEDCNNNQAADACEVIDNPALDCNQNLTFDSCDLVNGISIDLNSTGRPDECEYDLLLAMAASQNQAIAGEVLHYNIVISNQGPGKSKESVLSISLPSEIELRSIDSSVGDCNLSDGIHCSIPSLEAGQQTSVNVEAVALSVANTRVYAVVNHEEGESQGAFTFSQELNFHNDIGVADAVIDAAPIVDPPHVGGNSGSDSGIFGCSLGQSGGIDPVLMIGLLLAMSRYLWRRRVG